MKTVVELFWKMQVLFTILFIGLFVGCSKDDGTGPDTPDMANKAPGTFSLTRIENNATEVDRLPTFIWTTSSDPDGDTVFYDFYLSTDPNATDLYASDITDSFLEVSQPLSLISDYYWRVTAKDGKGKASSTKVNKFTTRNLVIPPAPIVKKASFPPRRNHTLTLFKNELYLIAGFNGLGPWNDVWRSPDGGHWDSASQDPGFSARNGHTTLVFRDRLLLIGGYTGNNVSSEVWSSEDGVTWTSVDQVKPFPARAWHTAVVFKDRIWLIGGHTNGFRNDVWYSEDGATWEEATPNAGFSPRTGHASTVFDGKMWVIGGDENEDDSTLTNDVWYSEDGIRWTQATASAFFSARGSHTAVVYDDKLWVLGGIGVNGILDDIWYSKDGTTWDEARSLMSYGPKYGHASAVFDNRIWVVGGSDGRDYLNDVWAMD